MKSLNLKSVAKIFLGTFVIFAVFLLASTEVDQRTFLDLEIEDHRSLLGTDRSVRGVYLHSRAITEENVEDWISLLHDHNLNGVVIDVKNVSGEVTYDSDLDFARKIGAVTGRLNLVEIVSRLRQEGIYVIARLTCFRDAKMAKHCCGGGEWVDPADELIQEYNLELAEEVAYIGFDEIQLDYIRYDDEAGKIGGDYRDRSKVIADFVRKMRERIPSRVKLSLDVYGRTLWSWNSRDIDPIGQNLDYLQEHVDVLSPMIYPSHYQDPDLVNNPAKLVRLAMETAESRLSVELRPFIQGFDRATPPGMNLAGYIQEELRGLAEVESEGYLVWNPRSNYESLWQALGS